MQISDLCQHALWALCATIKLRHLTHSDCFTLDAALQALVLLPAAPCHNASSLGKADGGCGASSGGSARWRLDGIHTSRRPQDVQTYHGQQLGTTQWRLRSCCGRC